MLLPTKLAAPIIFNALGTEMHSELTTAESSIGDALHFPSSLLPLPQLATYAAQSILTTPKEPIMSRAFAAFGVGMAAMVGIATSYVTFQPELQRQREEREGTFQELNHEKDETQISRAILSDFQEAKEQAMDTKPSGPAWKFRRLLFGAPGRRGKEGRIDLQEKSASYAIESSWSLCNTITAIPYSGAHTRYWSLTACSKTKLGHKTWPLEKSADVRCLLQTGGGNSFRRGSKNLTRGKIEHPPVTSCLRSSALLPLYTKTGVECMDRSGKVEVGRSFHLSLCLVTSLLHVFSVKSTASLGVTPSEYHFHSLFRPSTLCRHRFCFTSASSPLPDHDCVCNHDGVSGRRPGVVREHPSRYNQTRWVRTWKHTQQACRPPPRCASAINSALGLKRISHGYPVNSSSSSRNMSTQQTGTCARNLIASGDHRLPVSSLGCDHCTKNTMYDNKCPYRCPDELNKVCPACAENKGPEACHRTCRGRREFEVNQVLWNHAAFLEQHEMNKRVWMEKIRQGPASHFAKYDRILLQHFGLEVFFASTKMDYGVESWPRDFRYCWHAPSHMRTTICYLTLPRAGGPSGRFVNSSTDGDEDRVFIEAAQALPVDLTSTAAPIANMRRRFTAAMKALALTPSIHPSQKHASPVSANKLKMRKDAESKDAESKDAESKDAESKDAESKDAESKDEEPKPCELAHGLISRKDDILGPDYPQLTLLVNTRFHFSMETTLATFFNRERKGKESAGASCYRGKQELLLHTWKLV
ncbi:hypothetical protein KC360_g232 [Hortaea werneckii]|nr:hypothetical protein KC344_g234 [Hortaea werneckii]KAI7180405.1 hypothetical protein KC360_g232 [Hortaea werneckii]